MAVIPLQGMGERSAWSQLMDKYPTLALVLQAIGDLLGYFANGQFLVDAWRWAVLTAGNVSEAALMFAALWITAASVEPDAINQLPYGIPAAMSTASMFALTLLPEVIVYHAIAVCYDYWRKAITDVGHRASYWPWAVLYSLPTLTFLAMTIYTLCSFVSIGHTFAAPSWVLTGRVLAGWSYGVVGLIHAAIHKKSPVKNDILSVTSIATIAQPIVPTMATTTTSESAPDSALENGIPDDTTNATTDNSSDILPESDSLSDSVEDSITFRSATGETTSETKAHAKPARGACARKAATIMKKIPDISPADLAKRANISQTYARQLLAKAPLQG